MQTRFSAISISSAAPFPHMGGEELHKGNLCPALRQVERGQRTIPVSPFSQLPSAQNNCYVKVAYFWVTHSNSLQEC